MSREELLARALHLHRELQKLRAQAQALPSADANRWRLVLRAEKIGQQLKVIHQQYLGERP